MKLLTQEIRKNLPPLGSTDGMPADEVLVRVKFFTPDSNWTWFATEFDPESGTFYGLVHGMEKEFGYFRLADLEAARGAMGLPVERDLWFGEKTLAQVMEGS